MEPEKQRRGWLDTDCRSQLPELTATGRGRYNSRAAATGLSGLKGTVGLLIWEHHANSAVSVTVPAWIECLSFDHQLRVIRLIT